MKVCQFPQWAKKEKFVEEVTYLVGEFVEVDNSSLLMGEGGFKVDWLVE